MKKFLFLAFLIPCLSGNVFAQFPIDEATGKVSYSEVIETDLTKDQLYINAQTWITKTFGDYKQAVQFEDKEMGKIVLKGSSKLDRIIDACRYSYNYGITIECKNNKYKYTITDIYIYIQNLRFNDLSRELTLEEHLEVRNITIQDLNKLLKEDISKLSKKEKKQKLHEINVHQSWVREYEQRESLELEEFSSLQESLKTAMNFHEEF